MPAKKASASGRSTDAVLARLRAFGLAYPGAHLKSPWPGHLDLAVNDKTFAYLSIEGEPFSISCKLPRSSEVALMLPFCSPTAYGLGKSGWVSATFEGLEPPVEMLEAWIDESYRAQAPKKLLKQLAAGAGEPPAKTPPKQPAKTPPKKPAKAPAKKPAKRPARAAGDLTSESRGARRGRSASPAAPRRGRAAR